MDPVTHSLTGAALSRAGLNRTTPLATATLVLAANAPDIDAVATFAGAYTSLAVRRGITHGPLAMLLLPFIVTACVLLYDRGRRRRRQADAPRVRPLPTLGLATLGVLTHPALDWMNTYGIRLLAPFSERWFYGDALFIIDPWVWLALAAPLVGVWFVSRRQQLLWSILAVAATGLVLAAPMVPVAARVLWLAGVAGIIALTVRHRRMTRSDPAAAEQSAARGARVALAATGAYIVLMVAADGLASRRATAEARAAGMEVRDAGRDVMVAPMPANPFTGDVVVATDHAYHRGEFRWWRRPHVAWDPVPLPVGTRDETVLATLRLPAVRNFLRWSRYPYVAVQETDDGYLVRFGDARYPGGMEGGLGGITVRVDRTD